MCVCVCMCVCILNCLHEFFFFLQAWFNAKHVFRPSFEVTTHALGCTTKLQNATAKLTLVLWSVAFLNTIKIITAHIYIYIYIEIYNTEISNNLLLVHGRFRQGC